ncbi:hypothetical protein LEN26_002594 [Aphanomyces euteiches]|nr:hypothetical protein AeMF1_005366 [Aphanomyces euteiches]KAH9158984.1 hypothetical protein LEN26_002594 [Aphanomyces euteiches]KAH9183965.1 hypothetical protein AeNC1_014060 [Aphanomyces euteiches]
MLNGREVAGCFSSLPDFPTPPQAAAAAMLSIGTLATVLTAIVSVAAHDYFPAESPEYNSKAINDMFAKLPSVRKAGEAFALYDWDNTMMFGDISESSVWYQVSNLNFRFSPADFDKIFSLGYTADSKDECFPAGLNSVAASGKGQNVTLADLIKLAKADYTNLYNAYIAPTYKLTTYSEPPSTAHAACGENPLPGNMTLAQIQETTVFNNFAASFGSLVFYLENYGGADDFAKCAIRAGMTALPQMLVGMTKDEIHDLIRLSMRANLKAAIGTITYTHTDNAAVTVDMPKGLRIFNGQEASLRAMRSQNMSVYIISASPQEFVEIASTHSGLTYEVPSTNTYGVRFQYTADGKFTGELVDQTTYPITWGPGKAWVSENLLSPRHNGAKPVYASGDANGDCAMMHLVRDGVVMVNNRLKTSPNCIQSFYELACQYYGQVDPSTNSMYIMQGQDKEMGSWINSGWSTKNGKDYSSGATKSACLSYKTFF